MQEEDILPVQEDKIIPVNIVSEMKSAYIDYSMSVIVSRALPDVRDGFKPVHRRVLFGMDKLGVGFSGDTKKSARIVGEVMGKYHPHGDSSIYLTMVRLAQDWALRYPLVAGQGNFGSIDGDSPAAMRYTEAKLGRMGEEMLRDLDSETVDFVPNFDNTLQEPSVLPTRIPNLLVNGASGIAVGMATNMPPHNLTECLNASIALIDNPELEVADLMQYVTAPDFPTGGEILGLGGVRDAYETGRGRVIVRAKAEIESNDNHDEIVITEIPYGVIKKDLVKNIADLVEEKKIDGISDITDTSARGKIHIAIEIKRDANAKVVLNKLYKLTQLQSSFSINNVALVNGRPYTLNLKELLTHFVNHRHEVVIRRTRYLLRKAEERAHILKGLMIAIDNIDEVIRLIRASSTADEAIQRLVGAFEELDEIQARAIVEMRLRQLTNLENDKLRAEYDELMKQIAFYHEILENDETCRRVMKDELVEIRDKYGDERKTSINLLEGEFNAEDFYPDDEMIITISHLGYIKRTPLTEFRAQNRGGIGAKGSNTRDEDFIEYIYPATNHNYMLFFTQKGRCYWLKVYEIPEGAKNSKGRAIQNLLNIDADDRVNAFLKIKHLSDPEYTKSHYLVFCTKNGIIKKTSLEAYSRPRANGVNAIIIRDDDQLIRVRLTDGSANILMANRKGYAVRFKESDVREMGRVSTGVIGMRLDENDEVIGMVAMSPDRDETVLVVSANGYGKRSPLSDYRLTNRGAKGVKTINVTEKTGELVAILAVEEDNDVMIINQSGIALRTPVADIKLQGRVTQGVKIIDITKRSDTIACVCKVNSNIEEEPETSEELGEQTDEPAMEPQDDSAAPESPQKQSNTEDDEEA